MNPLRGAFELLRLAWSEDKRRLVVAAALMLLQSAAFPLSANALGALTDAVADQQGSRAMMWSVSVAALVVAALTAGHFSHIFYFELGEALALRLQKKLIEITNGSRGIAHLERVDYADRLLLLRQELTRAGSRSLEAVLGGFGLGLAMLITALLLGLLNPWLLLLPLASCPSLWLGRRAELLLARGRELSAAATRRARHLFTLATHAASIKEVLVCGSARELRARQALAWSEATRVLGKAEVRAAILRVAGQIMFALAYVFATLLIVKSAVAGHRTVGDLVLVIALAVQVNQQVVAAMSLHGEAQRIATTLGDLRWAEALVAVKPDEPDEDVPSKMTRGIAFRNVSFGYAGTKSKVLEDVNLQLPAGSMIAIVGENGAGKTTLIKLLCGLYEPTCGSIQLDDVDLRRFDPQRWRARIAVGFQDFVRFEFVAGESVGLGDLPKIDRVDAVLRALRRAHSEDIVDRLPRGLDTQLGKSNAHGTELSGGEWQKLALGRAMMRDFPLLLILDEPTSSLDARAEHALFQQYAIGARRIAPAGAITLLVSHRFSTVRMADQILVVSGKRVSEMGTHDELMRRGGLYAELYGLQARAYEGG